MMPTTQRIEERGAARAVLVSIAALAAIPLVAAAVLSPTGGPAAAQDHPGSAELITVEQTRDYLHFIASDEMRGRRTPSRGLDITAKFLALQLSRWGLTPAGDDGGFLQTIELAGTRIDPAATFVQVGERRFGFGDDFLASAVAGRGSAEVVFAGHGWVAPARGIDPYEGIDVAGKVVVVDSSFPQGLTRRDLRGPQASSIEQPGAALRERGALLMIALPSRRSLAGWERSAARAVERGSIRVVGLDPEPAAGVPAITASNEMIEAIFDGSPVSGDRLMAAAANRESIEPFALDGVEVGFEIVVSESSETTQNVVGILEGSDPELSDEYVALGAHYDHVGVGRPVDGDSIYNGADDDGSGTTAILAMAEAFAKGERPRRSILFVWHAGEEVGMWGSRYVNENPPVPPRQIVAQLNVDMIGRSKEEGDTSRENENLTGPNEVYVIGPGVSSADLGEIVHAVNDAYLGLEIDPLYDSMDHPSRFFFRSDHIHYARNGIPIAFFFTGTHEDYHQPSDHADKIDYEKLVKVARTIYATAWELANRDGRPALDDDLPEGLRR